jgi:hypothetical protein
MPISKLYGYALEHRFSIPRNPVALLTHERDLANSGVETGFLYRRSSSEFWPTRK